MGLYQCAIIWYLLPNILNTDGSIFQVYPEEKLTAKAHFIVHYPDLIRRHGPLTQFWCMRFEGKHRLAKSVANVSCKFGYTYSGRCGSITT